MSRSIISLFDKSVTGLKLGVNRLSGGLPTADESQDVESTGEHEILDCGLVFKSIGYKSVPVEEGIPFDHKKGVIPSENGRVKGKK